MIALVALAISGWVGAQAPLDWDALVGSHPRDLSLNAAKERIKELDAVGGTQLWQDLELSYEAKRADLRKQEVGLKISPPGFGELSANRAISTSRKDLGASVLRLKTAEAIYDRFRLGLDWLFQSRQRRYHQEMSDLYTRRTEAYAKFASDPRFSPDDLVEAQVKRTEALSKIEGDNYSLVQIENRMRLFAPDLGEIRLDGDLLSPREVEAILSTIDPSKPDAFPDIEVGSRKLGLAQAKTQQEIASSNRWLSYLETSYAFDVDENRLERRTQRDNISFGFGIKIPLFDGSSQEIARRKADLAATRLQYQDDREDLQRKVSELMLSIGSMVHQMVVLDSFSRKVDAGGLFTDFALKSGGNPLLILSAKETSVQSAWKELEELRFLILRDYLEILHVTGMLVARPAHNPLLAKSEPSRVSGAGPKPCEMSHDGFTRLERYELKYHVPTTMLPALETFLMPWCELDPASERCKDGFYWVTSLYLDTPRHTFLKWGCHKPEGRFNMRIRAYGNQPDHSEAWHFELKGKSCDQVTKIRGLHRGSDPRLLWDDPDAVFLNAKGEDLANLRKFYLRAMTYNAAPFVLTQYRRKAWFGTMEDYARVTLDIGMRWREEEGFDFSVDPRDMRPSDLPDRFDPGCNAVLELKCSQQQIPMWMMDLIKRFGLVRSGFSKFESAGRGLLLLPQSGRMARV